MRIVVDKVAVAIDGTEIVHDASLVVERGESLAIDGRSGSGKSTLLYCVGGLRPATGGVVELGDIRIYDLKESERTLVRRSIGFMFQSATLFEDLSVIENVSWAAQLRGLRRAEAQTAARETLGELGLIGRVDARTGELSGGESQRVNLARAIVGEVSALLADEPIAALDEATSESVCKLIARVTTERGIATVVVSHDSMVSQYMTLSMTMRDGVLGEVERVIS